MKNNQSELVDFAITARKYKTLLTKKYLNRKEWVKPIDGEVKSLLPGTVLAIKVKVGDRVNKDDLLLIQEAMKMQCRILAPIAGTVQEVRISAGERIAKDTLMITIE